uniref:Cytochrome c oxidase subunit 2 n=1 Tax=Endecameris sp. ZJUH 20220006 TaxID=2943471 RepID=A0A9E8G740_9HYME|nr:cytochrome c oxidase subunit 2 [Endecameris sp. ZJUH 20220006]
MNTWNSLNFQDSASPIMEWLMMFHDYTLFINILITMLILMTIINMFLNNIINLNIENQLIEFIWTIIPMIMLIFLAIPSTKILYLMDEMYSPIMSIKCIGHQWFWTFEYPDFSLNSMEMYMNKEIKMNSFRLLDVNSRIILPLNIQMRLITTSDDVIHSLAMPSLGLKIDAIPGRLNQINLFTSRPGLFFGQCSEICGANHSFMPINFEITNSNLFIKWINLTI